MGIGKLYQGERHWYRGHTVDYSYIDQDKVETNGIQSQYTLEYLRHKLVAQLQANLWKRLHANISYRMQDRTGTYTNADGEITEYKPYGIVDARLSWNADNYTMYVEANNLLNKTYVDFGHIPQLTETEQEPELGAARQIARIATRTALRNLKTLTGIVILPKLGYFARFIMERHGDGLEYQLAIGIKIILLHQLATIEFVVARHEHKVVRAT